MLYVKKWKAVETHGTNDIIEFQKHYKTKIKKDKKDATRNKRHSNRK